VESFLSTKIYYYRKKYYACKDKVGERKESKAWKIFYVLTPRKEKAMKNEERED